MSAGNLAGILGIAAALVMAAGWMLSARTLRRYRAQHPFSREQYRTIIAQRNHYQAQADATSSLREWVNADASGDLILGHRERMRLHREFDRIVGGGW